MCKLWDMYRLRHFRLSIVDSVPKSEMVGLILIFFLCHKMRTLSFDCWNYLIWLQLKLSQNVRGYQTIHHFTSKFIHKTSLSISLIFSNKWNVVFQCFPLYEYQYFNFRFHTLSGLKIIPTIFIWSGLSFEA